MGEYNNVVCVIIGVLLGLILSLLNEVIFAIVVAGFISTYFSSDDSNFIGIFSSLIVGMIVFFYGSLSRLGIPINIIFSVESDNKTFFVGFIIVLLLSLVLGSISSFLGKKTKQILILIDDICIERRGY